MAKKTAGLLLFRETSGSVEVLLAHPGGPFWARKDDGAWSIPKGELEEGEDPLDAAKREFEEEMGTRPQGEALRLEPLRQAGGKLVHAYAMKADFELAEFKSNTFTMEWPPGSGRQEQFPEVDRAAWFAIDEAERKILKSQAPLLAQLRRRIGRLE